MVTDANSEGATGASPAPQRETFKIGRFTVVKERLQQACSEIAQQSQILQLPPPPQQQKQCAKAWAPAEGLPPIAVVAWSVHGVPLAAAAPAQAEAAAAGLPQADPMHGAPDRLAASAPADACGVNGGSLDGQCGSTRTGTASALKKRKSVVLLLGTASKLKRGLLRQRPRPQPGHSQ